MFAIVTSGAVTSANSKTILSLLANSRRPKIHQIIIGSVGAVSDGVVFGLYEMWVNGTGTSVVPKATDTASSITPATGAEKNYTVEPTYDSDGPIATFAFNELNTIIWEPPVGGEPVCDTSGGTVIGYGIVCITGPTVAKDFFVTAIWEE